MGKRALKPDRVSLALERVRHERAYVAGVRWRGVLYGVFYPTPFHAPDRELDEAVEAFRARRLARLDQAVAQYERTLTEMEQAA